MHLTTAPIAILGLGLAVSAAPAVDIAAKPHGGFNAIGSIYRFGDPIACRQIFRQYGACGISKYFKNVSPDMPLIAMPATIFDKYGAAQNNKLCGKTITLKRNSVSRKVVVADRNLSNDRSFDMCLDTWQAFGGQDGDGTLIRGFGWTTET